MSESDLKKEKNQDHSENSKGDKSPFSAQTKKKKDIRVDKLAKAMRENLLKRKQQLRLRDK